MKEALFYDLQGDKVRCSLCPHFCLLGEAKKGICGVRVNKGGKLWTEVYGRIIAAHLDPVEKKPLFHFLPGTKTFSIATPGCNFQCPFCQNWEISQIVDGIDKIEEVSPEDVVNAGLKTGANSISYTYTEPTIFFEFAMDTGIRARKMGLKNIFVTNGYISTSALSSAESFLDAANVDLKSFREEFYKKMCKGKLYPVLDAIKWMKKHGIWVEITTLLIPNENDDPSELRDITRFIFELGDTTPWHISRFHPDYKFLSLHPTSPEVLYRAYEIGKSEGLKFVYIGNLPGTDKENTYCPFCGKVVLRRRGFTITEKNMEEERCVYCGQKIDGIF